MEPWQYCLRRVLIPPIGFCHEHALILYVYLSNDDMESVLTVCNDALV